LGRTMGKLVRTIPVVALVTTALMVVPSGAGAVTIGQTAPTTTICTDGFSWVQPTVTSGSSYVVPSAGAVTTWVVTSWSTDASVGGGSLAMKVFRQIGDPAVYMAVGHDGPRPLTSGQLNTFTGIQVPVETGDVLGLFLETNARCANPVPGETPYIRFGNDLADGESDSFTAYPDFRLNISAQVEADCDQDGLGDDTQDADISSCAPTPPPEFPPPSPPSTTPPPSPPPGQSPVAAPPTTTAPPTCRGIAATIFGTVGSDQIAGTAAADVIAALSGNDTVAALGGNDVVCGGPGRDTLKGGKGKDTLLGQKGKDKLFGQKGKDKLSGKKGKDLCVGGPGKDTTKGCEVEKSI
jgi:RTX calcium-binding nonapeptide repeat (4 copies)